MGLLLIDTSGPYCAALLRLHGNDRAAREPGTRGQDAALAPMVQALLGRAGLVPRDLSAVAVIIGPGTFTGVRIGVSFARALALALGLDARGINALDVLALQAAGQGPGAGVCDIGRGDLAFRFAREGVLLGDYACASLAEAATQMRGFGGAEPVLLAGSGAACVAGANLRDTGQHDWSLAAVADLLQAGALPAQEATPFYHRPPDAKLPGGIAP